MGLKPMNCPAHIQLYAAERRSYRDLPIRYSEQGLVHRHEPSGTLHGLLRVRHITQDDAHIFCTEEQIEDEVIRCLDFGFAIYDLFGFEPRLELSTRPEKRIGTDEMWDRAEAALAAARSTTAGLELRGQRGRRRLLRPEDRPAHDRLDRPLVAARARSSSTTSMPERFELTYTGADNAEHRPVMIHRALMGSFERFIGILIEHYAGEFPLWLAPVQAIVLPIADRHVDARRRGPRRAARGRAARRGRRPHRVRRAQDPRGRAAQDPVHARRRRPRGRAEVVRRTARATGRAVSSVRAKLGETIRGTRGIRAPRVTRTALPGPGAARGAGSIGTRASGRSECYAVRQASVLMALISVSGLRRVLDACAAYPS